MLLRWSNWRAGRTVDNDTYKDFFFEVVRNEPQLINLNVFEVLDSLVNSSA